MPLKKDGDLEPTYWVPSRCGWHPDQAFRRRGTGSTEDPEQGRNATEVDWADNSARVGPSIARRRTSSGSSSRTAQPPREWPRFRRQAGRTKAASTLRSRELPARARRLTRTASAADATRVRPTRRRRRCLRTFWAAPDLPSEEVDERRIRRTRSGTARHPAGSDSRRYDDPHQRRNAWTAGSMIDVEVRLPGSPRTSPRDEARCSRPR